VRLDILWIFVSVNYCQAGDLLLIQDLLRDFVAEPWRFADLVAGLDFAESSGWIDQGLSGYQLTDRGLAESLHCW
jgi:hypothetical protein